MNTTNLARKIAASLLVIQKRFAAAMSKRASACSPGKLKLISGLFLLFYCSLSTMVTIRAFTSTKIHSSFRPRHIRINPTQPSRQVPSTIVTKELYETLLRLRRAHERSGITLSTGMRDSITQLEKIYLNQ